MPFLSIGLCTSLTAETFKKLKELGLTNISDFCASSAENISRRSDIPLPVHIYVTKYFKYLVNTFYTWHRLPLTY